MGLAHPKPKPNPNQAASRIAAIRRGQKSRQKMAAKPRPLFVPKGIPDVWAPLCKVSSAPARVRVRVRLTLALALALALALTLALTLTLTLSLSLTLTSRGRGERSARSGCTRRWQAEILLEDPNPNP